MAGGSKQPAIFLGLGAPERWRDVHDATNAWLGRFGASLRATSPRAVVCISPFWVTPKLRVTTAPAPATLPHSSVEEAVSSRVVVSGNERVARGVIEKLLHARIDIGADDARGIDHGAWMPLSVLFPEADLPVVQLSVLVSGGSEQHLAIGRAIEPLRDEGVLVVGTGAVALGRPGETFLSDASRRFEVWVTDLVTRSGAYARSRGLAKFRDHPDLLAVHPNDAHFLPLLVVAGAASADKKPENVGGIVHAGNHGGMSTRAYCFRH